MKGAGSCELVAVAVKPWKVVDALMINDCRFESRLMRMAVVFPFSVMIHAALHVQNIKHTKNKDTTINRYSGG